VLNEFLERAGYRLVAVFDNDPAVPAPFPHVDLYHGSEGFERWFAAGSRAGLACAVAIGGGRGGDRVRIQHDLAGRGLRPVTLVHPAAYVATNATLGRGSQVLAGAVVGAEARLGEACIVNTAASVDHQCELGPGVHVGPGATLAGCVVVGDGAFVGAAAVVLPRLRIGRGAVVGAGAVVTRDVDEGAVVQGNPARVVPRPA
jgi:sugar O-acyltransferase (sialic acid O-acetyltransferase NeuD family)